jgi:heptosyltransferase I
MPDLKMPDLNKFGDSRVRILVVKLSSFGDIIHATGALRAIHQAFPKAAITMAVEKVWADVVRHNPHVHAVIESSTRDDLSFDYVLEIRRQIAQHGEFEIAIDFQGNRRSAAWVYLSGAQFKFGRGGFRPGWRKAWVPDLARHAVQVCGDICTGIGIRAGNMSPEIHTGAEDEERLERLLHAESLPAEGYILLNPFSRWVSKSWPVAAAAEVIARLHRSADHRLILTGALEEQARAESLLRLLPPGAVTPLVGRLPLGQALCLFRRARLMVSCDSGPMHAAAAFGVPVVALFGPTHPERTGPWGEGHSIVQARRPLSRHAYRTDPEASYMRALDGDRVFDAITRALRTGVAA